MGGFFLLCIVIIIFIFIIAYSVESKKEELYNSLKKEVPIFPNEHVGKDFIVLGPVSSDNNKKREAEVDLMQQAKALGANGIICSHFNVSSNLSGSVSVQKDLFGNNPKIKDTTSVNNTFHFMGTAIKFVENSKENNINNINNKIDISKQITELEDNAIIEINKQKQLLENAIIDESVFQNRVSVIKNNLVTEKERITLNADLNDKIINLENEAKIKIEKQKKFLSLSLIDQKQYQEAISLIENELTESKNKLNI